MTHDVLFAWDDEKIDSSVVLDSWTSIEFIGSNSM